MNDLEIDAVARKVAAGEIAYLKHTISAADHQAIYRRIRELRRAAAQDKED